MMRARCAVTCGAILLIASEARAQNKPLEFITAVPNSPAFIFLGATPSNIEKPGGLRDLGVALKSGIGEDGRAKEGFSLDASVWNLIPGHDIPLEKYRSSRAQYALGNLQLSLGTIKASGDSADLVGAIGLKTILIDGSDPMLSGEVTSELAKGLRTCAPDQPGEAQSAACVDSVAQDIIANFTQENWNAPQLAIAIAAGTRFNNAEFDQGAYEGFNGWIVGATGLGTSVQIIGQATYKSRTELDSIPKYRALNAGARITGGSATWNAFVEFGREWRSAKTSSGKIQLDKEVGGWSAGVEFRLMANTWISTGLGTRFQTLGDPDETHIVANIKWGVTSQSRIGKLTEQ